MTSPLPARFASATKTARGKPTDITELVVCAGDSLGDEAGQSWRLVWFKRKLKKLVFELEAHNGAGEMRIIGKFHEEGRAQADFEALRQLHEAGFRPPGPFTVSRPVAYIPERKLLLQEKAPGRLLNEIMFTPGNGVGEAVGRSALWLAALHGTDLPVAPRVVKIRAAVARYGRELAQRLPRQAHRVAKLTACALGGLQERHLTPLVPSHGDFHSKNVLITENGQVTAIDLETFGRQERAADVGYFLAQTAIRDYLHRGSFAATADVRRCFLQAYLEAAPVPYQRLSHYLGMSFLQSLHYEVCVLKSRNTGIVEPWLRTAENGLIDGAWTLQE